MSSNTIFEHEPMVTIPQREYEELLEYRKIGKKILAISEGDSSEH